MNVLKNMEAVFVAATVVLCSYAYQTTAISEADVQVQQTAPQAQQDVAVQTVVITAKRG